MAVGGATRGATYDTVHGTQVMCWLVPIPIPANHSCQAPFPPSTAATNTYATPGRRRPPSPTGTTRPRSTLPDQVQHPSRAVACTVPHQHPLAALGRGSALRAVPAWWRQAAVTRGRGSRPGLGAKRRRQCLGPASPASLAAVAAGGAAPPGRCLKASRAAADSAGGSGALGEQQAGEAPPTAAAVAAAV